MKSFQVLFELSTEDNQHKLLKISEIRRGNNRRLVKQEYLNDGAIVIKYRSHRSLRITLSKFTDFPYRVKQPFSKTNSNNGCFNHRRYKSLLRTYIVRLKYVVKVILDILRHANYIFI